MKNVFLSNLRPNKMYPSVRLAWTSEPNWRTFCPIQARRGSVSNCHNDCCDERSPEPLPVPTSRPRLPDRPEAIVKRARARFFRLVVELGGVGRGAAHASKSFWTISWSFHKRVKIRTSLTIGSPYLEECMGQGKLSWELFLMLGTSWSQNVSSDKNR